MSRAPDGVVETGAPSFVVLGLESMGLSAQPTDLHLLPDGRILAVSLRELAFGDGLRWEVYRGVEGSEFIAPHVAIDSDGRIYTGIRGGFASVDLGADARWHLTRTAEAPPGVSMDELTLAWVATLERDWYWFSGSGALVAWRPGQTPRLATKSESAIADIFQLGEDIYVSDESSGALFRLPPGETKLERLSTQKVMVSEAVTCTLPLEPGKLLVGTNFEGLKVFDGRNFQRFGASALLGPDRRITALCTVGDGLFAAAVNTVGIVFFDRSGTVIQILDRSLDQRLARVKRLIYSADGVVWALLNEGVARVRFPSPLSHFEPLVASGLTYAKPLRHQGALWLLADGRAMRGIYDQSGRFERFEEDAPPGRFVFTLSDVDGQLFACNDAGIFVREGSAWRMGVPGIVNARVGVGRTTSRGIPYVARGEYGVLEATGQGFIAHRTIVPGLGDNYGAVQEPSGMVWLELGTSRVGRFNPNEESTTFEILGVQLGFAEGWISIYQLEGIARFHAGNRTFRFDEDAKRFVEDRELLTLFPANARPEGRVARDPSGRLWYTSNGLVHMLESIGGDTELTPMSLGIAPMEYTIEDNGILWLFDRQRLARLDPRISPPPRRPLKALITSVEFSASGRWQFAPRDALKPIDYVDNSIVMHFAAPANPFGSPITFDVMLEGAGSQWVSTGTVGSASFHRLKEGGYVFRVRPRAGPNLVGEEARLEFTVRPPWFRTKLAWAVYVSTAIGLFAFAAWLFSFLQRRENERLEHLVGERTSELQASEERYRTLNTELEQRVDSRTAELSLSNRELQQRESLFRLIFEHAPVGISWKRSDLGDVHHLNAAFRRILELPTDTSFDQALLLQLVHPDDTARQARMTQLIKSGESDSYNIEERFVLSTGKIIWGSLSLAVVRDDAGWIVQEIGILEDITPRKQAEQELATTYKNLVATSRIAGMAEVATGVLHNVGNVLNSLNVSSNILADGVQQSKTELLVKLAALINEHSADLGDFLTRDPKGKLVPDVLSMLAANATQQQEWLVREITGLQKNIDHIKEIVAMQQSHATMAGVVETVEASTLFEDALRMSETTPARHRISIIREYSPVPPVTVEKGKVLQILINLIGNAKYACDDAPPVPSSKKTITLRIEPGPGGLVRFIVEDNGVGIAPENLTRIFAHGFTTRADGHGFGLHSSILAATEMKGSLSAASGGVGRGATFTLELPISPSDCDGASFARAAFPLPSEPKSVAHRRPPPVQPVG